MEGRVLESEVFECVPVCSSILRCVAVSCSGKRRGALEGITLRCRALRHVAQFQLEVSPRMLQ